MQQKLNIKDQTFLWRKENNDLKKAHRKKPKQVLDESREKPCAKAGGGMGNVPFQNSLPSPEATRQPKHSLALPNCMAAHTYNV